MAEKMETSTLARKRKLTEILYAKNSVEEGPGSAKRPDIDLDPTEYERLMKEDQAFKNYSPYQMGTTRKECVRWAFTAIVGGIGIVVGIDPESICCVHLAKVALQYVKHRRQKSLKSQDTLKISNIIGYKIDGVDRTVTVSKLDEEVGYVYDHYKEHFEQLPKDDKNNSNQNWQGELMKIACLWNLFQERIHEIKIQPGVVGKNHRGDRTKGKNLADIGLQSVFFPMATGINFNRQMKSSLSMTLGPIAHIYDIVSNKMREGERVRANGESYTRSSERALEFQLAGFGALGSRFINEIKRKDSMITTQAMSVMAQIMAYTGTRRHRRYGFPPFMLYKMQLLEMEYKMSGIEPAQQYNNMIGNWGNKSEIEAQIWKMAFTGCHTDNMAIISHITGQNFTRQDIKKDVLSKMFDTSSMDRKSRTALCTLIANMAPLTKGCYTKSGRAGSQVMGDMTCSGFVTRNVEGLVKFFEETPVYTNDLMVDLTSELRRAKEVMKTGSTRGTLAWRKWDQTKRDFVETGDVIVESNEYFYN